jgi:hypothetical protein
MKKRVAYLNGFLFVACFIFGRPFIVLVYTYIEWGQAVKNEIRPTSGYVTVETWACAYSKQIGERYAGILCMELQAARYLLIPTTVLGAVILSVVIWIRVTVGKDHTVARMNRDGYA